MMKKVSLSIKTQLTLTFITISSIIIFFVTYFNFISNVDQQKNSFIQNSLIQANLLAEFSVSPIVFQDQDGADENLEKLKSDENILRVIIFDKNQNIFAQYNPLDKQNPINIQEKEVLLEDNENKFLNFGTLKILIPIKYKDNTYGTLYIEKSTKIISKLLKKIFNDLIFFTLLLLLVIYAVSIILSNYLLKPILLLAKTAEDIASTKNYSTRVKYNSRNEIGSLYNAFNILVIETQNLTDNLEQKVLKRTEQLNNKTSLLEQSLVNLKETQKQLIQSEKMSALGNLVSGIAHEVNTPLGNAITSSSIITKETQNLLSEFEQGTLKRSIMEKRLDILNQSATLLTKTLNYASSLIRSFKQISVDQVTNDVREIKIKDYINEIFLTNHNKLKLIPTNIQVNSDEEIIIKTSPGVIAQILNNLIQNSIIHAFEDFNGNAQIIVTLKEKDENLIIEYEDNGNGISEDVKQNVFEPFITTKRNAGGTGLGLNIVYNLVHQRLKGSLELISKENLGTKFIINIPKIYSTTENKK